MVYIMFSGVLPAGAPQHLSDLGSWEFMLPTYCSLPRIKSFWRTVTMHYAHSQLQLKWQVAMNDMSALCIKAQANSQKSTKT